MPQPRDKSGDGGPLPTTYRFTNTKLKKIVGSLPVREATPARMDAALRSMRNAHGATMARQSKSILRGALQLAVMASVINANPVRDVQPVRSKSQPKGAVALTADQLGDLLVNLQTSEFCEKHDLVDPITLLIATGIRRSELLALRWSDFDEKTGMLTVAGKVIRVLATLIDDEGLSARIGADHLGHSHVSMTQDRYMTRGRIHTQVADLLERTVRINDE